MVRVRVRVGVKIMLVRFGVGQRTQPERCRVEWGRWRREWTHGIILGDTIDTIGASGRLRCQ